MITYWTRSMAILMIMTNYHTVFLALESSNSRDQMIIRGGQRFILPMMSGPDLHMHRLTDRYMCYKYA
jgi:hypothetical protein